MTLRFKLFVVLFAVSLSSCFPDTTQESCSNGQLDAGETAIDCGPTCDACDQYFTINTNFSNDGGFSVTPSSLESEGLSAILGVDYQFEDYCYYSLSNHSATGVESLFPPYATVVFNDSLTRVQNVGWTTSSGASGYGEGTFDDCNLYVGFDGDCSIYGGTFTSESSVTITQNDNIVGGYIAGTYDAYLGYVSGGLSNCPTCSHKYHFTGSFKLLIKE